MNETLREAASTRDRKRCKCTDRQRGRERRRWHEEKQRSAAIKGEIKGKRMKEMESV